jgi:hypothetical protein
MLIAVCVSHVVWFGGHSLMVCVSAAQAQSRIKILEKASYFLQWND